MTGRRGPGTMAGYNALVRNLLPDTEFHQNRYARELGTIVRAGTRWLDLGAGPRIHHGWLGPSKNDLRSRARIVVGCDLSAESLRRNPDLTAKVLSDGRALPFRNRAFTLVTANMLLEHLSDPTAVLREVHRILEPGGWFVFITPNLRHPAVFGARLLFGRQARRRIGAVIDRRSLSDVFPTFYRANSTRAVRRIAQFAGFSVVRLETFSSYPIVKFALPLTFLECLWIRLTALAPLTAMRSNLVGCLERVDDLRR